MIENVGILRCSVLRFGSLIDFSKFLIFFVKFFYFLVPALIVPKIPEPVGSVSPKVNSGDDYNNIKRRSETVITLFCNAQSHPIPVFRWVEENGMSFKVSQIDWKSFLKVFGSFISQFFNSPLRNLLEPIGSVSPKVNVGERYVVTSWNEKENINLIVASQGHPTPVFR